MEENFMTQEGYDKLKAELIYLQTTERDNISERIKVAKSYGDLSENSEYDEAKAAHDANEIRIGQLEHMLETAKIIDEGKIDTSIVQIGNTVLLENLDKGFEVEYTIVGLAEANLAQRRISNVSPLGKGLIGKKKGEIVNVEAPAGIMRYKIKNITI